MIVQGKGLSVLTAVLLWLADELHLKWLIVCIFAAITTFGEGEVLDNQIRIREKPSSILMCCTCTIFTYLRYIPTKN